jgi:hypothetical protein
MHSKTAPRIILKGIIRRNSTILSKQNFDQTDIKFSFHLLPVVRLVRKWNVRQPLRAISRVAIVKNFLILISRVQLLLLAIRWKSISIEINFQELSSGNLDKGILDWAKSNRVYVAREIGFVGFHLKKFDLSLEYDLLRFLNRFEVVLTSAIVNFRDLEYKTGSTLDLTEISIEDLEMKKILNSTFIPVASENTVGVSELNGSRLHSNLIRKGELESLGSSDSFVINDGQPQGCWGYREFSDAHVLHGLIVSVQNKFYLSDPKRHANWGSEFNLIPGVIFQASDGSWMTPEPLRESEKIAEAIFIGGTNNLMHTVLEDLPRVIFGDLLKIDCRVPIIVSSLLSPQILDLLAKVSGRRLILCDLYSQAEISRMHFFEFDSPLPSIMKGDYRLSSELFPAFVARSIRDALSIESEKYSEPRRRILILRENGLFRPITNMKKVQKLLVEEFRFEAHFLSEMSLQVASDLFSQSNLVVGEYGAGLANSIHMDSGATILEIRGPREFQAREYEILVTALGLKHSLLVGKSRIFSKYGFSRGPYAVPINTLRQILTELTGD